MILDERSCRRSNLTVVAIILIGVIVAVVTPLINSLMSNTANRACCTDAGGIWKSGKCTSEAIINMIQLVIMNVLIVLKIIRSF